MTHGRHIRGGARRTALDAAPDASRARTPDASPAPPAGAPAGRAAAARRPDPRLYQIAILAGLVLFGVTRLDFEVTPLRIALVVFTCLATQWVCMRLGGQRGFDPKSPLISALGLAMLLRTGSEAAMVFAAVITIAAKFVLRVNGKHVFNPTNFSLVVMMLLGWGWVSPGQWGSVAFFAFLLACLGGLVVNRAARSDVTYAFLAVYTGIVFGRALWLGEPLAIPLHHLQNGAFLIFTFFMISDPKTTPDSRAGRMLFAFAVAATAAWITFGLHRTHGLLWALAALSLTTPLIDRFLPGRRYRWTGSRAAEPAPPARNPAGALARSRAVRGASHRGTAFPGALAPLLPAAHAVRGTSERSST